jgi:NAD-dependent dihydropyrimidine dehydrogenase PreA subunit
MNVVYVGLVVVVLLWIAGNLYRKHKNRGRVIYVDKNSCAGCWRCVKICSRRVLEAVEDETGARVAVRYPSRCTACGDCIGKCRYNALKLIETVIIN